MKFKIINGQIIDPTQKLNLQKKTIYVDGGVIVKPRKEQIKEFTTIYDVEGKIIMAGGIDIHSHIAGGNVNNARLLVPEMHKKFVAKLLENRRNVRNGRSRWTVDGTGFRYAEMGFTTVVEPAILPINSFITQLELQNIPIIDKGGLGIVGNDNFLLDGLSKKKGQSFLDDYIGWMIDSSKCLGIKVINAGGSEVFKRKGEVEQFSIDDIVPSYGVSSRQILEAINIANENLKIPHPVHVHCNNLGMAGNVNSIIDTIEGSKGRRMHLAHIQFYGYGNQGKNGFSSGSEIIANLLNKNKNITVDIGQVMFGPTMTISSDLWKQNQSKQHAKPNKWILSDLEDGGGGVIPYTYDKKNYVNALQWSIGLELFLMVNDPWRVFLTTDHPNGGPFTMYPKLIRLLMDKEFRESEMNGLNSEARNTSLLGSLKREYSLYEIAIMTRASPANILGLNDRGSLKPGKIADISIYDPKKPIDEMFSYAYLLFKEGKEIVKNGKITNITSGNTLNVKLTYDKKIRNRIQKWFDDFYSLDINNFEIEEEYFNEGNFKNFESV